MDQLDDLIPPKVLERIKRIDEWYDELRRDETRITFPDEWLKRLQDSAEPRS